MLGKKSAKIKNTCKGFTLIEMLVVIFVMGIGLIGALAFFNVNFSNQFENKNELIAAGLAQEGVELARNIRDYNLLNGNQWYANLDTCTTAIDFNTLSNHQCSSMNQAVCTDASSHYCQCNGGSCATSTNFTRSISVSVNADTSRTVTCTVSWNGRTTKAVDYLYDTKL